MGARAALSGSWGWLAGVLTAVLILLGLGAVIGTYVPWSAKPIHVETGTLLLSDSLGAAAGFTTAEGARFTVPIADIWWERDGDSGRGIPPCVTAGTPVTVETGWILVRHPDGESHREWPWLHCPALS